MASDFGGNLDILFGKMQDFVSSKTVVGEPIIVGEVTLLPLIDVTVGVGAGSGSEKSGGGGLGAKITPSAVLAIYKGNVQLINIKNQDAINKLIDMAPGVAAKLNFGSFFGNKNTEEPQKEEKHEDATDSKTVFEEKIVIEKE